MKPTTMVIVLFCAFLAGCAPLHSARPHQSDEVFQTVEALLDGKPADFTELWKDLPKATRFLVHSLGPVQVTKLTSNDQPLHPGEMRVVRAIRALRFLTGCEFRAHTRAFVKGADFEQERWDLLFAGNPDPTQKIPFFSTRMSTDTIWFAPTDVQFAVIEQWQIWHKQRAQTWKYPEAVPLNDWYF